MKAVKVYRIYGEVAQAYGVPDACLECFSNCVAMCKGNTIKGVSRPLFGLLLVDEWHVIDVNKAAPLLATLGCLKLHNAYAD